VSQQARSVHRVAVMGAGYFSQFHLHGWQHMPGIELVAVCDVDEQKAKAAATQFGAAHAYASAQDMLAVEQIDLIDIVTPPAHHRHLVEQAVDKGIAVICQKPFATSYSEAESITRYAEQAGVPLVVHENFRFMPWFREIRRLIDEGLLGNLHGISFRLRTGDGQGPDAYLSRQPYFQKMTRLLVAETAVHYIDTFRYLCGEVHAVYARLRRINPVIAGEDAGFIHFEFKSGLHGNFDGNRLNDHVADNPRRTLGEVWLEGEKGVLRLDGNAGLHFKPHRGKEQVLPYDKGSDVQFGGGACAVLQQHVVNSLRTNQPIENTARDYLRNLRIQEAVYASNASGQRIEIDSFHPPETPQIPFP
jgi:D-apiose dehydrogenase